MKQVLSYESSLSKVGNMSHEVMRKQTTADNSEFIKGMSEKIINVISMFSSIQ
ncbi:hypothetical protein AC79_3099 [Escherichia coli 8-415-05_S4_C1]|nr:hypothetical protein AC80_3639 [Escherichia coli 1-110-08_S4_C1]KEJ09299.1 hypothetical protein AD07_3132 [Escherichia coli 8-415-05_S4_C2]KEJ09566.1 hypothetical protein AC79_3099 [Escherichia coli 8-415-05_S4_C1]KEJ29572.1 hypothetical protein AD36_3190 [Escherichia coli 8-415-05_S4_C3]KEN32359.1 hypothetical protein AC54_3293 [Escherichia coli 8-415-05_S3_C3]KEN39083.1 hypothetical protein AB96_3347 [Escherichia coli 8-415-05_S3_C1]